MGSFRVNATEKVGVFIGGSHRHIEVLCLEDRRRIPRAVAIRNIRHRTETYYTFDDGERAEVEVATQCSQCYREYLRTNRDSTTKKNLLELPDC